MASVFQAWHYAHGMETVTGALSLFVVLAATSI